MSGSVAFRLPWRRIGTENRIKFEEGKLYRVSGRVDDIFNFKSCFLASGYRQIIIYVPVDYLNKIRPTEVHQLSVSSVDEVQTKKPISEIVNDNHVSSWQRFAKSKLVDEEHGEDFGDGPPRS